MKNVKNKRGVTLIELLICLAIIAGTIAAVVGLGPGCSDLVYPHDVSGRVAQMDSRLARSQSGSNEKFVLRLDAITRADTTVKKTAGSPDGTLDVECTSTRCALLKPGSCVDLECNREVRWFEPNIIECKLVKEVTCTGPSAPAPSAERQRVGLDPLAPARVNDPCV